MRTRFALSTLFLITTLVAVALAFWPKPVQTIFSLERVFTWNLKLTAAFGEQEIVTYVEYSPKAGEGLLVWMGDWPDEHREHLKREFETWALGQAMKYTFYDGKRIPD